MLLALTQWLAQDVRAFNVFQYITLRAVLATLTALAISLLAGPLVIRKLADYKIGQAVRDNGPQTHLAKAGTPPMGGALVLLSILITTLLWADLSNRFVIRMESSTRAPPMDGVPALARCVWGPLS